MLAFKVIVAGTLQDPPDGVWRHTQHADKALTDPYRAREAVGRADRSGHLATGFAGATATSSPGQAVTALMTARHNQTMWGRRAVVDRLELVSRFHTALEADRDAFTEVLIAEGTPRRVADTMVDAMLDDTHSTAVQMAVAAAQTRLASRGRIVSLRRLPHGVIGLQPSPDDPGSGITAGVWALATGNTLVVNCPPNRPLSTAYAFHRLVQPLLFKVGMPGILSVLCAPAPATMTEYLASRNCDAVWYQGDAETALRLRTEALNTTKTLVLDLHGGCDGVLVWRDADVPAAVHALTERFHASGQLPSAPRYALVHPDVAEQVVDLLTERAAALLPGLPSAPGVLLSALADRQGFERDLEQAVTHLGARLTGGGRLVGLDGLERVDGVFAEPTVAWISVRDAHDLSCIGRTEAAYPLMPVVVLDEGHSEAERLGRAIQFMNDRPGAVRNTLWATGDDVIALFADGIRNGSILSVNDSHLRRLPGLPSHGGTGHVSGYDGGAAQPWVQATRLQALADATALGGRV